MLGVRSLPVAVLALLFVLSACTSEPVSPTQDATPLEAGFANPPRSAAPAVYWYWISDDISAEGITRDLEAMASVGIVEALIGNVDVNTERAGLEGTRGPITALSDQWWSMVAHAMREGQRLGVDVGLFNAPGWSQSGGPWVRVERSMRYLTHAEITVRGPAQFAGRIDAPDPNFQDVAVIAMPRPSLEGTAIENTNASIRSSAPIPNIESLIDGDLTTPVTLPAAAGASDPLNIDITVKDSFTARSIEVHPGTAESHLFVELQLQSDEGEYQTVRSFDVDRRRNRPDLGPMSTKPITASFSPVTGKKFRLRISNLQDGESRGSVTEIRLTSAARLERYVEKQLGKMWQTPAPSWDTYMWDPQDGLDDTALSVSSSEIIDLTDKLQADGTLRWNVPAGEWVVARFGMAPTNVQNAPASPEATGLEIDKMNAAHVRQFFNDFVGEALRRIPEADRQSFKTVVIDSYEVGSQNWTDGFADRFEASYGYDPIPWLPVLTGRVVGTTDQSERFLWDLRRLVADMISYEYVGTMRDEANRSGLSLWIENYGHWGYPGESLQYGGQSNQVGAEFWVNPADRGPIEIRAAASAAHTYGLPRVSAEAFTNNPKDQWSLAPWSLKPFGDRASAQGINHFVLHVYIHQPRDEKPGVNAWFGTEFNRNNTWFHRSYAWIDYLKRSHFLLQQGDNVADIAYFTGQDAPKMTGIRSPELPDGYEFDYVNAEAIVDLMTVEDGDLVLPGGSRYRLLVLPPQDTMTPEVLTSIARLVMNGAAVYGPAPVRSPSLRGYPDADRTVRQLAEEMWGDCALTEDQSFSYGRGKVFCGGSLPSALARIDVPQDVSGIDFERIAWAHRTSDEGEIYFVANHSDDAQAVSPSFRDGSGRAELWDPVTGERFELDQSGFDLAPRESVFVVFRNAGAAPLQSSTARSNFITVAEVAGPWAVHFDPEWGAPEAVVFDEPIDWTEHTDDGVRHYSGSATYVGNFDVAETMLDQPLYLDLGNVRDLAHVTVNGIEAGVVWTAPWRVDVSGSIRAGENSVEIEVTNGWANRIIGDARGIGGNPLTTTIHRHYDAASDLLPAGLIGPITLQTPRRAQRADRRTKRAPHG